MVLIILSNDAFVALNSVDKIPQSNLSKEFCQVVSCRSAVYFTPVLTEKCLLFVEGKKVKLDNRETLVYVFRVCMIKEHAR